MKLSKILKFLEEKFPLKHAEEWDNVGLMVGERNKEVKRVQLSLDLTQSNLDIAIENKIDLIITHHPLLFKPLKSITDDSILGKKIMKLIENKIAVYSMHTNLDSSREGLNDYFSKKVLNLENGKILDKFELNGVEFGIGRIYELNQETSQDVLIKKIKEKLKLETINFVKGNDKIIKKVAIITGSGANYWRKAKREGADILITGDVKYHDALDAMEENFNILDVGHFESEWIFSELIKKMLEDNFDIYVTILNGDGVLRVV